MLHPSQVLVDFLQELLHPSTEVRGLHDSGAYQVTTKTNDWRIKATIRISFPLTQNTTPSATSVMSE